MPLPTAAELTDPNATNTQIKQLLVQLAEGAIAHEDVPQNLLFDPFNETVKSDGKDELQSYANAVFQTIEVDAAFNKPALQSLTTVRRNFDIKKLGLKNGDTIFARVLSRFDSVDSKSRIRVVLYSSSNEVVQQLGVTPTVAGLIDTTMSPAITITSNAAYIRVEITGTSDVSKRLVASSFSSLSKPKILYGALNADVIKLFNDSIKSNTASILENTNKLSAHALAISANTEKLSKALVGISSKNLMNPNDPDVAIGYYVSATTGELIASANYNTSGFIEVVAGLNYSFSNKYTLSFYNASKVRISGLAASNTNKTFLAPTGAKYLRASVHNGQWGLFQVEQSDAPTAYVPYHETYLKAGSIQPKSVGTSEIGDKAVTMDKASFFIPTKNLFNKAKATIGKLVDGNSGGLVTNATYDTSDFIEVTPSTKYFGSGATQNMRTVCFYNENKVTLSSGITSATDNFTTPSSCHFVRFSLWHSNLDNFQLELSEEKTSFVEYGFTIKSPDGVPILTSSSSEESLWSGKKWTALGDSITANANWQGEVVKNLGLIHTNRGIGGTRISGAVGDTSAMCQNTRIDTIPLDTELLTVMGGTNDWAQNIELGDIDGTTFRATFSGDTMTVNSMINSGVLAVGDTVVASGLPYDVVVTALGTGTGGTGTYTISETLTEGITNIRSSAHKPTTFYGALVTLVSKAYKKFPEINIAIATTPYGQVPDWTSKAGWSSPAYNSKGLTANDYADAIRNVCKKYNIALIDVALYGGWNTFNISEWLGSTTDNLHPRENSLAALSIGQIYTSTLKQIKPV